MNNYIIKGSKYRYVELSDSWAVEILDGKYSGLKYKYTNWTITEIEAPYEGEKKLDFGFEIITKTSKLQNINKDNKEMLSMMGNILLDILLEKAMHKNGRRKN